MNLNANLSDLSSDDKKKLIALGVLVLAVIAILIFVFTRGSSAPTETAEVPPTAPVPPPGMPGGVPGEAPAESAPPAGGGGDGNVTAATFASLGGFRGDPFTPEYLMPPPPPPPPPPPLRLPSPEALPTPGAGLGGSPYMGLPPAYVSTNTPSTVMRGLPPIDIPQLRRVATAPQKFEAPKLEGGTSLPAATSNKRLSGVIIGDSIHALLEIVDSKGTKTYVVQPGDTVAGIRILSIRRVELGGKVVPRMLISENGEEKYVDLRSGFTTQQDMQPGGMGQEGFPGMPGGFPGMPAIRPAPNILPQETGQGRNPFSAY